MREIRFRAWDNQAKVMLPVVDIEYLLTKGALITDYKYFVENIYPNIMQYTGLFDKQGVEIYEGDVLQYPDDYQSKGKVMFRDGGWHANGIACYINYESFSKCEVIGNIFQHPHLLGGE